MSDYVDYLDGMVDMHKLTSFQRGQLLQHWDAIVNIAKEFKVALVINGKVFKENG